MTPWASTSLPEESARCRTVLLRPYFHNYLFGLARNRRLQEAIAPELDQAQALSDQHQQPTRIFKDLSYRTHKSWSRQRRVVAKAEVLPRARRRSQDA